MTPELTLAELLGLLDQDYPLLEMLLHEGLLPAPLERAYSPEEAEAVRVARVLVREMDVNLAGVEVILHMRQQIYGLRQQMLDVLTQVREAQQRRSR